MKVEFSFDKHKVEQHGYTLDTVHSTIKKNFAAKNLCCVADGDVLAFQDNGGVNDFANMWAIIMALLRTTWFVPLAASCTWYEDDGSEEDVLSQAWKVHGKRMA